MSGGCQPSCSPPSLSAPQKDFSGVAVHRGVRSEGVGCRRVFRETEPVAGTPCRQRCRICGGSGIRVSRAGFAAVLGLSHRRSPHRSLGMGMVAAEQHLGWSSVLRVAERGIPENEKCWDTIP